MSTLSSSSSYSDVVDAYLDNASYEEDGSASKAKAFLTACRILLRYPERTQVGSRQGGHEMEFNHEQLRKELTAAQEWIAANDQSGGMRTTYGDFENFRWNR